jgi:hypothetical protein
MTRTPDQLIVEYLRRLDAEFSDLPRGRRREVVEEIAEHIEEARLEGAAETEAATLNLLDRLGDPAELAADARERVGLEPRRPGRSEVAALVLLLVGGFVFFVGWIVGVVLLWASDVWTSRDKIIGTLVLPGGLTLPLFLVVGFGYSESCSTRIPMGGGAAVTSCTGGPSTLARAASIALLVVLVLAPFATTAYLARRMRRHSALAVP